MKATGSSWFLLLVVAVALNVFAGKSFASRKPQKNLGVYKCQSQKIRYKIWRVTPSGDLALMSIVGSGFKQECMSKLAEELTKVSYKKKRAKIFLFDNDDLASGYARGKYEWRDLPLLIRGMFYYDAVEQQCYLKYSTAKGKPWDEVTIYPTCKKREMKK